MKSNLTISLFVRLITLAIITRGYFLNNCLFLFNNKSGE